MPYQATYINPLVQFGSINLTLLLEDDAGVYPPARVEKKFRYPEQVTEAGLLAEAQKEIDRLVYEFENPPEVTE